MIKDIHPASVQAINHSIFKQGNGFQGNMPLHLTFVNGDINQCIHPLYQNNNIVRHENINKHVFDILHKKLFPFLLSIHVYHHKSSADSQLSNYFSQYHNEEQRVIHNDISELDIRKCCEKDEQLFPGNAAHFHLILLSNGDIVIHQPNESYPFVWMGNIQDTPIEDIWYSEQFYSFRAPVLNNKDLTQSFTWKEENLLASKSHLIQMCKSLENQCETALQTINKIENNIPIQQQRFSEYSQALTNVGWYQYLDDASLSHFDIKREANYALYNQGEHFQGNMPVHLEISVTEGCNIKCKMCNLSQMPQEQYLDLIKKKMDTKKIYEKLVKEVFPYIRSISFAVGGEPTIHPDLPKMIQLAKESGVSVRLTTNGLKLRQDDMAEMCVNHVDQLTISIDGATKKTYETIRKGSKWERVIAGIQKVTALRRQNPNSRLRLTINYTLMQCNIEEFPDMIRLAHELGVSKVVGQHLLIPSGDMKSESLFSTPERCNRYVKEAEILAQNFGIELQIPDYFVMKTTQQEMNMVPETIPNVNSIPLNTENPPPHCRLLNYSAVVIADGQVMPCSHPDVHIAFRMGNLTDSSFQDIWYGDGFQNLRSVSKGTIPEPCANCAMLGKTTGGLPVQNKNPLHTIQSISKTQSYHSKAYLIKRLLYKARLHCQIERLEHHQKTIEVLLFHMQKHIENLHKIKQILLLQNFSFNPSNCYPLV